MYCRCLSATKCVNRERKEGEGKNNMVKKTRSVRRQDSTGVEKYEDKWNYNGEIKRDYKMEGRRV